MRKKPRISVIMPCLNEEATVGACVREAKKSLKKFAKRGFSGDVIVVDNGSTDGSREKAKRAGAKVVIQQLRGYGAAYLKGLSAAKGDYLIIGDSDGTYDFRLVPRFMKALESGADLVLGSRFKGKMAEDAMPFVNRYIGNPILTGMLNLFYGQRISDAHTGMRAFTKNAYRRMKLRSQGMEFASEMIVKAIYHKLAIVEVPIPYSPRGGISKLSPLSDAWRHIKFMLLYAPSYLLIIPGLLLFILGFASSLILAPGPVTVRGFLFDIHTMTVGLLFANLGVEIILLGLFAKLYTERVFMLPSGPLARFFLTRLTVERLLSLGLLFFLPGITLLLMVTVPWLVQGFPAILRVREVVYGVGLCVLGAQIMFSSILFGLIKES